MRRIAVGPAVLVLLSLTGCGAAATKTTTAPAAASPMAAQRAVVGVLTKYENAYSAHNASGLGSTLATNVVRTGEGTRGCEHVSGETAVLAAYEAQWTAGAGRYQFIGLSPQAVKIAGLTASVNLSYRIAPASEGPIEFRLATNGKEGLWFITNITANCHKAPAPAASTPVSSEHLSDKEYKELEGKTTAGLLIFLGGGTPHPGEEGSRMYLKTGDEALSEEECLNTFKASAPCFRQFGESDAHLASEVREQATRMATHVQGPCAEALQADVEIWTGLERVAQNFEHSGAVTEREQENGGSGGGEEWEENEWQHAAAPAEHLVVFAREVPGEEPRRTELGAGLEACRPPGDESE